MGDKRTRIDVDADVYEAVKEAAVRQRMSVSEFIRAALLARVHRNDEAEEIAQAQLMNLAENMATINRQNTVHAQHMREAISFLSRFGDQIPEALLRTLEEGLAGITKSIEATSGVAGLKAEMASQAEASRLLQTRQHDEQMAMQRWVTDRVDRHLRSTLRAVRNLEWNRLEVNALMLLAFFGGMLALPIFGHISPGSVIGRRFASNTLGTKDEELAGWMLIEANVVNAWMLKETATLLKSTTSEFGSQYARCLNHTHRMRRKVSCKLTISFPQRGP